MSREIKDLFTTDWCDELDASDKATRKEGKEEIEVVLLAGLQRLARSAGIVYQECVIQTPAPSMVQAIYSAVFKTEDGEVKFVGTADCNGNNTKGKFACYPTAVAESRAEARCLRKALGIRMLSSEEIGFREGASAIEASPKGKVGSSVVKAIETLCTERGVDAVQVLEKVLSDDRAATIMELSELTTAEAQKAMAWLNEQKPASTKSKRDARKAELEAKQ
jgi:hypothetical protein